MQITKTGMYVILTDNTKSIIKSLYPLLNTKIYNTNYVAHLYYWVHEQYFL